MSSQPKKTFFKDLPEGVYRSHLLPYLSLKDLHTFDSALLNHKEREWYLLAISGSNETIDAHAHNSFLTMAWLVKRGVQVSPHKIQLFGLGVMKSGSFLEKFKSRTIKDHLLTRCAHDYWMEDAKIVFHYLIEQKVDINTLDRGGENCLSIAIANNDAELLTFLLDHGVDVADRRSVALHPLILALQHYRNCEKVCQLLLSHPNSKDVIDVNYQDNDDAGKSSLHYAASKGYIKTVELLLARDDIVINPASFAGWTPFINACAKCNDCVKLILEKAIAVDMLQQVIGHMTNANENGLMWACRVNTRESLEIVNLLLSYHDIAADIANKSNDDGFTPLHFAASIGSFAVCQSLCNTATNVNAKTTLGDTPLHLACSAVGDAVLIRQFLRWNADQYAINSRGYTPFHLCILNKRMDLMRLFVYADEDTDSETTHEPYQVNKAIYDPQHKAPDPLIVTGVMSGDLNTVRFLLKQCNANIDAVCPNSHYSGLHYACKKNHAKMVELLLSHGASTDLESRSGLKPWELSTQSKITMMFKGAGFHMGMKIRGDY